MSAAKRIRPAPSVHAQLFDGELVILNLARGEYLALDRVGSTLWKGLEAGRTIEEVAREIVAEYHVSLDQALADLESLARDFVAQGLFVVGDRET